MLKGGSLRPKMMTTKEQIASKTDAVILDQDRLDIIRVLQLRMIHRCTPPGGCRPTYAIVPSALPVGGVDQLRPPCCVGVTVKTAEFA